MYSTNRKSKTKPSAVAHVVSCVCTLLILACGVEIERPPGEPVEDCRAQPETCEAPNRCLEALLATLSVCGLYLIWEGATQAMRPHQILV